MRTAAEQGADRAVYGAGGPMDVVITDEAAEALARKGGRAAIDFIRPSG